MYKDTKANPLKKLVAFLWILFICLYFINNTYSRYFTADQATAQIQVAKWAVKVTDSTETKQGNFVLNFVINENANIVEDRIAPNATATAEIILDLTGTEVSVDYIASIDDSSISSLFGTSASTVSLNTSVAGAGTGTSGTINLPSGEKFTSTNGKVTVTLTLTWVNNENYNTSDTTVGITAGTLQIPVSLTIKQHI